MSLPPPISNQSKYVGNSTTWTQIKSNKHFSIILPNKGSATRQLCVWFTSLRQEQPAWPPARPHAAPGSLKNKRMTGGRREDTEQSGFTVP